MNPNHLIAAGLPGWIDALTLAVGWALVLFLAQGLAIGLGVAALLGALRGRSAGLRYAVALAGLMFMAACPVATAVAILAADRGGPAPPMAAVVATMDPAPSEAAGSPAAGGASAEIESTGENVRVLAAATDPSEGWRSRVEGWLPAVVLAWLAGVCALGMRLALGFAEVRGLMRRGLEAPPPEVPAAIDRLLGRLGWGRRVRCFLSRRVEVPSVVGWLRPMILIPVGGLARLTALQVEALLAHELAHARRHDFLVNALQAVVEALLFFHPAVWWVSRRVRAEREHCCDDWAVALCGGDRLLVARTLFALEEQRGAPALGMAASGGSLRERIRRLVAPSAPGGRGRRREAGWAGAGLMAALAVVSLAGWLAIAPRAQAGGDAPPAGAEIGGRIIDSSGKPVEGARVRLYRRDSRWDRSHPAIGEAKSGPDGSFRLEAPVLPAAAPGRQDYPRLVLLADHPGLAFGWRIIPEDSGAFRGEIVLTEPSPRTITVVDEQGRPVVGATVQAYDVGDSALSAGPFREMLNLRAWDGPLAATTDAEGRATLGQLPRTQANFAAVKPGYAETYAFREQDRIRLTPAAELAGTVTSPDGKPLSGIEVVLYTAFMWSFERTKTDDRGRYRIDGLKAKGWDMSAWRNSEGASGAYKVWIEGEGLAVPTQSVTLEPGERRTLDLRAAEAAPILVTLLEEGTKKPVVGARIWGFDRETGSGGRFNAYTDQQGKATFYSAPTQIDIGVSGPPEGTYIEGRLSEHEGAHRRIDFINGRGEEITLTIPPIAGRLVSLSGVCKKPDGSPCAGATVHATAKPFETSTGSSYVGLRRTDAEGRFTLDGLPAGLAIGLYAESEDGQLAGAVVAGASGGPDLGTPASLPLRPVVTAWKKLEGAGGEVLSSREFRVTPKVGDGEVLRLQRTIKSDAQGMIEMDRVVPGLSYHLQEEPAILRRLEGGGFIASGKPVFDRDLVLAPE